MAASCVPNDTWRNKKSQSVPCSAPFEFPKDTSLYFSVSLFPVALRPNAGHGLLILEVS